MDKNSLMAGIDFDGTPQNPLMAGYRNGAPSVVRRATLLPLAEYDDGSTGLAVPGILQSPIDAFWNMGDAASIGDWQGAGYAGGEAAGAVLAGSMFARRPAGSVGAGGWDDRIAAMSKGQRTNGRPSYQSPFTPNRSQDSFTQRVNDTISGFINRREAGVTRREPMNLDDLVITLNSDPATAASGLWSRQRLSDYMKSRGDPAADDAIKSFTERHENGVSQPVRIEDILDELNRNPATSGGRARPWDHERLRRYIAENRRRGLIAAPGVIGAGYSTTDEGPLAELP